MNYIPDFPKKICFPSAMLKCESYQIVSHTLPFLRSRSLGGAGLTGQPVDDMLVNQLMIHFNAVAAVENKVVSMANQLGYPAKMVALPNQND